MAKRGLYANINARKKAGTSRPKSKSTVSAKSYANMKAGFPKKKKKSWKTYLIIQKMENFIKVRRIKCLMGHYILELNIQKILKY